MPLQCSHVRFVDIKIQNPTLDFYVVISYNNKIITNFQTSC
jgi:hypothetical protein